MLQQRLGLLDVPSDGHRIGRSLRYDVHRQNIPTAGAAIT
jgi:hypothetical protein